MGRTIVEQLGTGQMDPHLGALFGQSWEILEVAAMSLGFGDVMTAIDFCADAVLPACGEPPRPGGMFYGLRYLRALQGTLTAPIAVHLWIHQLLAQADLTLLEECRHPAVHRKFRRHISVTRENGVPTSRALAEISTLHGSDPARPRGSIGELVPRLVGFGEGQLEGLCRAVLDTWGG